MDKKTAGKLNQINQDFYLKVQEYFNRTRQYYWRGFEKLLPYLANLQGDSLKVLDVACGNGRFGKFLAEKERKIKYTGIDNNQYLLDQAQKDLPKAKLIKQDIFDKWQVKDKYEVIVLLGILHHIPGFENRVKILLRAKKKLKKFDKSRKYTRRVINWGEFNQNSKIKINLDELEKGDKIIDWKRGATAYRYVHVTSKIELAKMIDRLQMTKTKEFLADGEENKGNKYVILKAAA